MSLNKKQKELAEKVTHWFKKESKQVFQFVGGPGTGKSWVLKMILNNYLNLKPHRVAPMSFTGAAAIVMRMKGLYNAKTAHSWLFTPTQSFKYDKDGNIINNDYFDRPKFDIGFKPKSLGDIDLIIIDEAGMIPYSLKDEIECRGIKILASGDLDQLPPINDKPAYLYDGDVFVLDEIMRQAKGSNIINISQRAKLGLPIHKGFYGDVLVIDEDELTDEMILRSDIVLCGKNKTRDRLNNKVREQILNIYSALPTYGEKVVCRKNNWKLEHDGINLTNGLVGNIDNMPDVGGFDGKSFTIDFRPNMLDSSFRNISCDYQYFSAPHDMKKVLKDNKYNTGEKFEYAYAITTHMSQGSQYANGIYLEEYLFPDINTRLNYTGITRFSNFLIYVKQKRKFY